MLLRRARMPGCAGETRQSKRVFTFGQRVIGRSEAALLLFVWLALFPLAASVTRQRAPA